MLTIDLTFQNERGDENLIVEQEIEMVVNMDEFTHYLMLRHSARRTVGDPSNQYEVPEIGYVMTH